MANIPNVRTESAVRVRVTLTDSGVDVVWSSLEDVQALIYSESQKMVAGMAAARVDEDDQRVLIVDYPGHAPQYAGIAKLVVRAKYQGREKTYDVPVVNFVETTAEATGVVVLSDPEISVKLEVSEVSTSILDDAIAAAFDAARQALAAADLADASAAEALRAADEADEKAALAGVKIQQAEDAIKDVRAAELAAKNAAKLANEKAGLASNKAGEADAAADEAREQARIAGEKAAEAERQGNGAKEMALFADGKAREADRATRDTLAAKTEAERATTEADRAKREADAAAVEAERKAADAATAAGKADAAAGHQPKIVDGFWYVWSVELGDYVATGTKAEGKDAPPYDDSAIRSEVQGLKDAIISTINADYDYE